VPATSHAARSYAKALFALAKERGVADAVLGELDTVLATVQGDPELQRFFARPWYSADAKRRVAMEIATRLGVSRLVRDFLALVAARGRADQLGDMVIAFRDALDRDADRVRARVRTAIALTPEEKRAIQAKIGRAVGSTNVLIEEVVDPTLLGGFVAEIGSQILDASLDGELAQIHQRLVSA
jgi:F-type H+-transporting ATPase subunit delta